MKKILVLFLFYNPLLIGKTIQSLKNIDNISSIIKDHGNENQVIPFNTVKKTRLVYIYDKKNNRVEYLNFNQTDINYSKSNYVIDDNILKLISVIDCLEKNCF